jgi:hypothetical protein
MTGGGRDWEQTMVELRTIGRVRVYFLYASPVFSLLTEWNGVILTFCSKKIRR